MLGMSQGPSPSSHHQAQAKKPISVSAGNRIPRQAQPHRLAPDVTFLKKTGQRHFQEAHVTQDINRGKIRSAFIKSPPCPVVTPPPYRFLLLGECPPLGAWHRILCSIHPFSLLYGFCQDVESEGRGEGETAIQSGRGRLQLGSCLCTEPAWAQFPQLRVAMEKPPCRHT